MRNVFFNYLERELENNKNIYLIVGDLGFPFFNNLQKKFPNNCVNYQAAEFAMFGCGGGLALDGKIPIVYTITPFILRAQEYLRSFINKDNIPVKIIGIGRDSDYSSEGFSHYAGDIKQFLDPLTNIKQYWPQDTKELIDILPEFVYSKSPSFLSLKK